VSLAGRVAELLEGESEHRFRCMFRVEVEARRIDGVEFPAARLVYHVVGVDLAGLGDDSKAGEPWCAECSSLPARPVPAGGAVRAVERQTAPAPSPSTPVGPVGATESLADASVTEPERPPRPRLSGWGPFGCRYDEGWS
jgi:hypothetical protein